jgi:class 3 adenylate cyclase
VLFNPMARWLAAPDYPSGMSPEAAEEVVESFVAEWLEDRPAPMFLNPAMPSDPEFEQWWRGYRRRGFSPSTARALYRNGLASDFRAVLPAIRVPTLVLNRSATSPNPEQSSQRILYVTEQIRGARQIDLPGYGGFAYVGDSEAVVQEIEEFVTGTRTEQPADRVLATVLYTDLASSTEQLSRVGDKAWHEQLDAHDAMVRSKLAQFRGREVKNLGDGFLATFDGPARALNCGRAIIAGARSIALDVRVGVHTGEIELRGDDIGGVTVHIGARVAARAEPGEVLVSRTVVDLVAGSGIAFADRGEHELKGVNGKWRLFAMAE